MVDRQTDVVASSQEVVYAKQPGEGIFAISLAVLTLFGAPRSVEVMGTNIDVDRSVYILASKSGDPDVPFAFLTSAGALGSSSEHGIIEQLYGVEGVSAVKAIQLANLQGLKTYRITSANLSRVVPILQVSNAVKADIQNAINAGKEIIIPETEIQVSEWKGVGYIVSDPDSGAGAYIINGGIAGGAAAQAQGLQEVANNQDTSDQAFACMGLAYALSVLGIVLLMLTQLKNMLRVFRGLLGVVLLAGLFILLAIAAAVALILIQACFSADSRRRKTSESEFAYIPARMEIQNC